MTLTQTTEDALAEYARQARAYVTRDCERYGLPKSGPMYESLVSYLVNPNAHDFRLTELPALLGRDEFLTISRRILDVGCGPGTLVWRALDLGHDAYGVDLSEEKVGLAQMWAEVSGRERWRDRVEIRDAGALTYASESFDLVTSYHVLEHVADLPSVLFEAVRVTKRGGWLELRAPDYRMSYDTHYCMPWPRFMPPAQAAEWCRAMGRPTGGIGTFFYITGPQVVALLTALGCRIETLIYREHRDSQVHLSTEHITADPIIFDSTRDVSAFAAELQSLAAAGRLPDMYKTCLEFTIAAQRL